MGRAPAGRCCPRVRFWLRLPSLWPCAPGPLAPSCSLRGLRTGSTLSSRSPRPCCLAGAVWRPATRCPVSKSEYKHAPSEACPLCQACAAAQPRYSGANVSQSRTVSWHPSPVTVNLLTAMNTRAGASAFLSPLWPLLLCGPCAPAGYVWGTEGALCPCWSVAPQSH